MSEPELISLPVAPLPCVLVVDDAENVHQLIEFYLGSGNVRLLHAYGGQEGLRMARAHRPSLILLDYIMPDCDGLEVVDALKQDPQFCEIPIIMITADNDRRLVSLAFEKGVSDYVVKPLYREEFRARVQAALRTQALLQDLKQRSQFDALTGLLNKSSIITQLQQAIAGSRDGQEDSVVMFIDFDRFKLINDSLGHAVGDLVLREASRRLSKSIRWSDSIARGDCEMSVARLGGDEFVILLNGVPVTVDVAQIADRILMKLLEPYEIDGRTLYLNASIGIVSCSGQYESADEVMRDADIAMYEAKEAGRGCFQMFHDEMRNRAQTRWQLDRDLRRAVKLEQFRLVYQPIVDLHSGAVESVEALVRWEHPERGLVPPNGFIPLAEETGIIIEIGNWVTKAACEQFVAWLRQDPQTTPHHISINLSRQQLVHPGFTQTTQEILNSTGISPSRVHFEVTESLIMDDLETSLVALQALRDLGAKIDLDDFGTGHSSLACLHQLPIDVLKLDRCLITTIDQGSYFMNLADLILKLLAETEIVVVAEGIETISQLQTLRKLGCPLGQGYYFSRPIPAEEVQGFVASQRMLIPPVLGQEAHQGLSVEICQTPQW